MTTKRKNDGINYGEASATARKALAVNGIVEAHALAKIDGAHEGAIGRALHREVEAGRAVLVFRGVYATPEVAARIRAAIGADT